jgi:hypothetical protein
MEAIMKTKVNLLLAVLIGMPVVGLADDQKLSCIKDITFSQEFLATYPKAGAACNQVVMSNGEKWARFDATVKKMSPGHTNVDFVDKQGNKVANMTFSFDPAAQVEVDGKPKSASHLEEGDKLVLWMPESRFGFYAKPGKAESEHFKLASSSSTEER